MISRRVKIATAAVAAMALSLSACAPVTPDDTAEESGPLIIRLWDDRVAESYRDALADFTADTGISVEVVTVPWADYWSQLRSDVAAGVAPDMFWLNAGNFRDYADAGTITPWMSAVDASQEGLFPDSALRLYTHSDQVWGVPQIVDPGIAVFVNDTIVADAGLDPGLLSQLAFDPRASTDSLRQLATALTRDSSGATPADEGYDPLRVAHYGYNASHNLNAILLSMIASNGGQWQDGDRFTFDSPLAQEAIGYAVSLINDDRVAPPASDTNPPSGGDHARDLFLQGRLALFQTGPYHLATIHELATFPWRIVPLPQGPAGALSPTNAIVMAANAYTDAPANQAQLLEWLAGPEIANAIARSGAAMPALMSAQENYLSYWNQQGVDISPMIEVLDNGYVQTPRGRNYLAAQQAYQPIINAIFTGQTELVPGLAEAVAAGNLQINLTDPATD